MWNLLGCSPAGSLYFVHRTGADLGQVIEFLPFIPRRLLSRLPHISLQCTMLTDFTRRCPHIPVLYNACIELTQVFGAKSPPFTHLFPSPGEPPETSMKFARVSTWSFSPCNFHHFRKDYQKVKSSGKLFWVAKS